MVPPFKAFTSNVRNCASCDQPKTLSPILYCGDVAMSSQFRLVFMRYNFLFDCYFASCSVSVLDELICEMHWQEEPFHEKKNQTQCNCNCGFCNQTDNQIIPFDHSIGACSTTFRYFSVVKLIRCLRPFGTRGT